MIAAEDTQQESLICTVEGHFNETAYELTML